MNQATSRRDSSDTATAALPVGESWSGGGKNERACLRCGKSFWAWDTGRTRCYFCIPSDRVEIQRILGAIGMTLLDESAPSSMGAPGGNRR